MERRGTFVLMFAMLVVVLSVSFVSAFYVDECPVELNGKTCNILNEENGEFKVYEGTCYETECVKFEKVRVNYDPEYVNKTIKKRLFDPRKQGGITPFDDIVCDVWLEKKDGIYGSPSSLDGRLVTFDKDTSEKLEILFGSFTKDHVDVKDDKEFDVYRWKIDGWPNGIPAVTSYMEDIVESHRIDCEVIDSKGVSLIGKKEKINNCVRLWGPDGFVEKPSGEKVPRAKFDFVTGMSKSLDKDVYWAIGRGERDMTGGYFKIDPFDTFRENFAFLVDLKEIDDDGIGEPGKDFAYLEREAILSKLSRESSCKNFRLINYYTNNGMLEKENARAPIGGRHAFLGENVPEAWIVVHETGHAFGKLYDERFQKHYDRKAEIYGRSGGKRNCVFFNPKEEKFFDDDFLPFGRPHPECGASTYLRTTEKSIMVGGKSDPDTGKAIYTTSREFNDWSCAYLVYEIDQGMFELDDVKDPDDFIKNFAEFSRDNLKCETEKPDPNVDYSQYECFVRAHCPQIEVNGQKIKKYCDVDNTCKCEDGQIIEEVDSFDRLSRGTINSNCKRHGTWIDYRDHGITKWEVSTYSNGFLDGPTITYQEDGVTKALEGNYVLDSREGKWTFYNEDGNKDREGTYVNNEREGIWIEYWEDGVTKSSEGNYDDSKRKGHFVNYFESGIKSSEGNYNNDEQHGDWFNYYGDGTLGLEAHYFNDLECGIWKSYNTDGSFDKEEDKGTCA